jgi:hypothetical protein
MQSQHEENTDKGEKSRGEELYIELWHFFEGEDPMDVIEACTNWIGFSIFNMSFEKEIQKEFIAGLKKDLMRIVEKGSKKRRYYYGDENHD